MQIENSIRQLKYSYEYESPKSLFVSTLQNVHQILAVLLVVVHSKYVL